MNTPEELIVDANLGRCWTGVILSHPAPLASGVIIRSAIAMALAHGFQSPFLCEHYGGDGLSVCAANRAYLRRILPATRETCR